MSLLVFCRGDVPALAFPTKTRPFAMSNSALQKSSCRIITQVLIFNLPIYSAYLDIVNFHSSWSRLASAIFAVISLYTDAQRMSFLTMELWFNTSSPLKADEIKQFFLPDTVIVNIFFVDVFSVEDQKVGSMVMYLDERLAHGLGVFDHVLL